VTPAPAVSERDARAWAFHGPLLAAAFLAALLRASWDLWAQTAVRAAWAAALVGGAAVLLSGKRAPSFAGLRRIAREAGAPLALFLVAAGASASLSRFPHSAGRAGWNDLAGVAFFLLAASAGALWRGRYLRATAAAAAVAALAALLAGGSGAGLLVNPNVLASFLLLAAPPALAFAREAPPGLRRAGWSAAVALIAAGFLVSGSFAAFLLAAAYAAFLVRRRARAAGPRRALALAGLFLAAGLWVFRHDWPRLVRWESDRPGWWAASVRMWRDHPLLGTGPGAFGEAYPAYRADPWGLNSLYAHNVVLETLAERGLAGAGALAWLGAILWRRREGLSGEPGSAALAGLGLCLAHGLGHIGLSFPGVQWSAWIAAGCAWGGPRDGSDAGPAGSPLPWAAAAVAAAGVVAWPSARLFLADRALARARYALASQDADRAGRLVEEGLAWNPREAELYSLRGRAAALLGRTDAAREDFAAARRLSPHTARFHAEAGDVERRGGDLRAALRHYEEASRLLPLDPDPWVSRGEIRQELGEPGAAATAYEGALRALDHPRTAPRTDLARDLRERLTVLRGRLVPDRRFPDGGER
jgi:tetratricopeptide (TPR) repeat protein